MAQDYYICFINEVYGQGGLENLQAAVEGIKRSSNDASRAFTDFSRSIVDESRKAGAGVNDLTSGLRRHIDTAKDARNANDDLAESFNRVNRASGGSSGGGAGGGGGAYSNIFGRIGGRIFGAEVLGGAGIPGGGFIGSQAAGGLGLGAGTLALGAAAFGVAEIAKHVEQTIKYAQEQRNLSKELGITISQMDGLSRVAAVTGVNLQGAAKATQDLASELEKGGPRAEQIADAFQRLGLSRSTAFEDTAKAFSDISAALAKIPNEADRSVIAIQLLGETAGRAAAATAGTANMLSKGLALDEHTLDNLAKAKDYLNEMWEAAKNLGSKHISIVIDWLEGKNKNPTVPTFGSEVVSSFGPLGYGFEAARRHYGKDPNVPAIPPESTGLGVDLSTHSITGSQVYPPGLQSKGMLEAAHAAGHIPSPALTAPPHYTAEDRDRMLDYTDSLGKGTDPVSQAEARLATASRKAAQAKLDADHYPSPENAKAAAAAVAAETAAKQGVEDAGERKRQLEAFSKLEPTGELQPGEVNAQLERLAKGEFDKIPPAQLAARQGELERQFGSNIQEQQFYITGPKDREKYTAEQNRQLAQADEIRRTEEIDAIRVVEGGSKSRLDELRGQGGVAAAAAKYGAAQRQSALSTYGLSPLEIAAQKFQEAQITIPQESLAKQGLLKAEAAQLRGNAAQYQAIVAKSPLNQEAQKAADEAIAQAKQKELEVTTEQISAQTKLVESMRSLQEASDKAAEAVKDMISSDLASILLGTQEGGLKGHPGQGAATAARGIATSLESKLLNNAIGLGLNTLGITGPGGTLSKFTGSFSPTLQKLFQGTPLENTNIDPKVKDSIDASVNIKGILDNTATVAKALGGDTGTPGSGTLSGELSAAGSVAGAFGVPVAGAFAQSVAKLFNNVNSIFNPIGAPNSGSSGQVMTLSGYDASGAPVFTPSYPSGGVGSGGGDDGYDSTITGAGNTGIKGINPSIIAGAAGIAAGVIGLVTSTSTRSEVSSAGALAGGIGSIIGAASPALAAAGPIGLAVGAGAALVSSLFPDPRNLRSQQVQKNLFASQYLSPAAWDISEGGNGGYADLNFQGGVRTSNLSPYPETAAGFLDLPRRTTIPSHTIGSFGGNGAGAPGAIVTPQPPTTITINAMDPASFNEFVQRNPAAIANGMLHVLQSGHGTEFTSALSSHLGLR